VQSCFCGRASEVSYQIGWLRIEVIPFDAAQARTAAPLRKATRAAGLSLGDRARLALALRTSLPGLTTDRDWQKCGLKVEIVRIR
jgi:PIN domain nuclease of toxin-antitoxin system